MTPPLFTAGSVEAAQLREVPAVQGDEPRARHPGQDGLVLTEVLLLLQLHALWSGLFCEKKMLILKINFFRRFSDKLVCFFL